MLRALLVIVSVIALIPSCDLFKGKDKKKKKVKHIFIHGDPHTLIEGAETNATSPFMLANLSTFSDFNMNGVTFFSSKTQLRKMKDGETIEDGREANEGEQNKVSHYSFKENGDQYLFTDPNVKEDDDPQLVFTRNGDRLDLVKFFGVDVKPIHYSMKSDNSAFTLLFEGTYPDYGEFLASVYFDKNVGTANFEATVPKIFNYLLGPGVLAKWNKDIEIGLCGANAHSDENVLRKSILAWAYEGAIGKTKINVTQRSAFKPFSDLDQQCLWVLDDFLFEDTPDSATGGITIPNISLTKKEILDSDIFISAKGIKKVRPDAEDYAETFASVTSHEFGHLLGLDHEFDKNEDDETLHESIMSYDDVTEVTVFDHESIAHLYGPNADMVDNRTNAEIAAKLEIGASLTTDTVTKLAQNWKGKEILIRGDGIDRCISFSENFGSCLVYENFGSSIYGPFRGRCAIGSDDDEILEIRCINAKNEGCEEYYEKGDHYDVDTIFSETKFSATDTTISDDRSTLTVGSGLCDSKKFLLGK